MRTLRARRLFRKRTPLTSEQAQDYARALQRGETVWIDGFQAHLRQRMVKCGKAACRNCPHGPYLYLVYRSGPRAASKVVERYVGVATRRRTSR